VRLKDAVVVVTGAGNGIGAAMSRKFAAQGAILVVNDLDANAVHQLAEDIGAVAVPGDAASDGGARELVDTAISRYGRIDLFCANAGVDNQGGPEAPDESWEQAWEVNVMAHVRAARAVLPHWLERGEGRFLATVSAAGLLTMLGSAPYSVTKHAALAFAEWLSVTYGNRGITVQALCPQGVRTGMLSRAGESGQKLLAQNAIEPEQVADEVMEALGDNRFLILPHSEVARYYALRAADPGRWQAAMRELQYSLEA
jgi:NAD(P)-dependent dehydrogenase (short-subunit alcohol dehydrogenase family)